jgi:hypothetical protein
MEYDDIIKSGTGTKYQNQIQTEEVLEEMEYDDIINSGSGTKYQNQTRTKAVIEEECYDDIIFYQNQVKRKEIQGECPYTYYY